MLYRGGFSFLRPFIYFIQVRAEVGRYGADVICLQECDSFDAILASLQDDASKVGQGKGRGGMIGAAWEFDDKPRAEPVP